MAMIGALAPQHPSYVEAESNVDNVNMRAQNVYNAIIGTQYISRNQKIQ